MAERGIDISGEFPKPRTDNAGLLVREQQAHYPLDARTLGSLLAYLDACR
jgi:hypothetical protein